MLVGACRWLVGDKRKTQRGQRFSSLQSSLSVLVGAIRRQAPKKLNDFNACRLSDLSLLRRASGTDKPPPTVLDSRKPEMRSDIHPVAWIYFKGAPQ